MAKLILINYQGEEAQFSHKKVDRSKLYGSRKRIPLDPSGENCLRCELSDDGSTLIMSGMTSQGYFDSDINWIPNKELIGMDSSGKVLDKVPATLGVAQDGVLSELEPLLDLAVDSIYQLDPEEVPQSIQTALESGKAISFPFNYREDYHAESAYLVLNDEGYFALIGNPIKPEWMELDQIVEETFESESEEDDDLDFEMF
jgi:hypothetical protein|tara:strand:+ start:205 stop:807 length:603 start_codon:yes stop_codon:yes gene_type:complete